MQDPARAQLRLVSDELPVELDPRVRRTPDNQAGVVSNLGNGPSGQGFETHESKHPNTREYTGPLNLGDPGVSASLWKESRGANDLCSVLTGVAVI